MGTDAGCWVGARGPVLNLPTRRVRVLQGRAGELIGTPGGARVAGRLRVRTRSSQSYKSRSDWWRAEPRAQARLAAVQ